MIRAHNLGVGDVLAGVTFSLPDDGCLGVIGLNGAGKSTLLALLAGVLRPDLGTVDVPPGSAYLPEGCPLDPSVPVRSWLKLARRLPGYRENWDVDLGEALPLPARTAAARLSQGQRVRLGLRMTLCRQAPAWLLDDPFLGLDPIARRATESAIAARCADGPVVLATQDTEVVERLCTHLLLLREGKQLWFAPLDDWRSRFRAVRVPLDRREDITALGAVVLSTRERGTTLEVVLDDASGIAVSALDGDSVPLSLLDLIAEVAA